jgi:hypothetical protein
VLIITIEADVPSGLSLAVKEDLAMLLEQRYGSGTRVIDVKEGEKNGR